MADDRLLAAVRRFWNQAKVLATYEAVLEAYTQQLADVTVIIGKSSEGESATGQVVVRREDYPAWMDVLEARLKELEAEAGGRRPGPDTEHVNFGSGRARS